MRFDGKKRVIYIDKTPEGQFKVEGVDIGPILFDCLIDALNHVDNECDDGRKLVIHYVQPEDPRVLH